MDKQLFLVVFGKWLLTRVKLLLFRVDMDGIRSVHYEAHLKGENGS